MNRKISVGMAVTIVILAMTVTFSITMLVAMRLFDSTVNSVKEKESMYNKIAEVDRYVRSNDYYTIDETMLYDRLTAGYLLGTGDKYARYYTANAYTELINIQSGKVMGIGVELGMDQTGYARVTKVYDGSPAQEAGIAVGDYITAIGDTDVKSLSGVDAVQTRLQGEAGTTVTVTWLNSEAASKTAELTHSGYSSTTVDYQVLDNVGYIKIRQFDGSTPSELDYALRSLTSSGVQSLVFDLRDNGGGVLDDAVSCIDLIAPEGTVAYAEDKNGERTVRQQRRREQDRPAHGLPGQQQHCQRGRAVRRQPAQHERRAPGGHHHHGQGHHPEQPAAPFGRQRREHHGGKAHLRRRHQL